MRIGIYDRWLSVLGGGERLCLSVAAHLSRDHTVTFLSPADADRAEIERKLNLRLSAVRFARVRDAELTTRTAEFECFINASQGDFIAPRAPRNVLLVYFPAPVRFDAAARARARGGQWLKRALIVPPPQGDAAGELAAQPRYRLYQWLFEGALSAWGARLRAVPDDLDALPGIITSYQHVWSISAFTARWVKRYWSRDSDILTPIVDVAAFAPGEKRKQILSVGRFFAGTHNKKHLEMIAAFRELAAHDLVGWELHLAGGTLPQPEHQAYLAKVRAAVAGAPVHLHLDASFDALRQLYAESSLYWHASGLGEDEERDPIKAEHFGITTVEAMAAGCVPVVIAKGGQPEIVRDGENGLLWRDVRGLQSATLAVARDEALRRRLADQAVRDSRRYDAAHFEQRLDALMAEVTAQP